MEDHNKYIFQIINLLLITSLTKDYYLIVN